MWEVTLVSLVLLGAAFKEEYGAKGNTTVRVIDLLLNLIVITWALVSIIVKGPRPLTLFLLYWGYRSLTNVLPLTKLIYYNLMRENSEANLVRTIEDVRPHYFIDRVTPHYRSRPVIYVANHALWCIDDVIALAALSGSDLLVVINPNPSGINMIPKTCRERMCVLDRQGGKRSGFEALRGAVKEEVLGKGRSLIIFSEDMGRKRDVGEVAPLRSGVFKVALEYKIPIVPMWIKWPCQFPTILRSVNKVLRVFEGKVIDTSLVRDLESLRQETRRQLVTLGGRC
jgi:1-acyl-sn-glycerol-3-phosphate acyltransferase